MNQLNKIISQSSLHFIYMMFCTIYCVGQFLINLYVDELSYSTCLNVDQKPPLYVFYEKSKKSCFALEIAH